MTSLAQLLADFNAKRVKLPEVFAALTARGRVSEEEHRADVALLEQTQRAGSITPEISRALIAKLNAMQVAPAAPDDDATMVKPAPTPAAPVDAEVTQVSPGPQATAPSSTDATVVKPASQAPSNTQTGGAGTHSSSSFNRDSWQRVAQAEGGEYATVGMLLKGRFLLEREIGRGGMGVVFLARDERKVEARDRDPYVAVKVLNDEFRRHPDSLIALQRESRRSQLLAHDNIVRVFDFDKDGTIVFMTMEFVDGQDLKTLIRERAYNGMPLAQARPLIEGMAWALKRAHSAGVVHSDFKPGNVMVTREGVPKVFDFGIARAGKHLGEATGEQTVFDAGTLGALTPAYASLEMIQGKEPTPSDDIYALGCVAFELLTGKHPFDKVSAEVALREGRRPPPVPGITKRQYKTLCDAVAFHGEQRLKTAAELIEGLREISLRERIGPQIAYGAGALVLLVAAGWGGAYYLHGRHIAHVIARFNISAGNHYLNEDQAQQALNTLSDDERKRLVLDQGDAIQNFLLSRINTYWDPAQNHYDYAGTQHVFQLRDQLKLYSPALDAKRSAIETQKNELLNTLDTQLTQRIDANAIFEDQPNNAVQTLATIRAIDPHSALLQNAELELKYDIAIGQSLSAEHIDQAKAQLALATKLFPESVRLRQREAQLATLTETAAAASAEQATAQAVQNLPQARQELAALIAKPTLAPEWQQSVATAMASLRNDNSPDTRKLVDNLANVIAAEAARQTDPLQVPQASNAVNLGLQFAPKSAPLLAQRTRLDALQQQEQAQLNQESAAAEVTSRIESVKRAAAANDIGKAEESLARIRALQPDNPFLTQEGPQLIANAYLGQADTAMQRGRYQAASDLLGKGLRSLGNRPDLRNAKARDDLVAAIMNARGKPVASTDLDRMKKQLADARKADADGLKQLESGLKQRGQLQGTLADLLDSMTPAGVAATPGPSAANPAQPAAGAPTQPGAPAAAIAKAAPGAKTANLAARAANGAAPANIAAPTAPTASTDPCNQPDLVGKGRLCFDTIAGHRGPSLVVVPGLSGGKPYALSRAEITVGEFNRFCSATGQCQAKTGDDPDSASLPISNITLAQARAYASWLSAGSGYVYRLPTDAEWMHAAQAGGSWAQASDSNCIPPSAGGGDDNSGAPISARGRESNPWGLVNMTGNVWEWVTRGGGVMVRGGSFTSYWSDCTVSSHRDDSGTAQKDVGFRILRELK
ncbi:MAG TPA: protein kinase [Dyella sp.]|uniref:protein kinase domain-containing protein n=1 Tax=Dyella sp. TaxID=1869338 RepID=UPI002BFA54E2|nr:protein kinase [Dyella sp.]HTV85790.1 protein kinase [Dyella sp.]